MSANPSSPQSLLLCEALRPMTVPALEGVMAIEEAIYPFPWSRGNFVDSIAAGYLAWTLNGVDGELIAYCVAMRGAAELHLLNITVTTAAQRRGHARRLLAELVAKARGEGMETLWLEVRASNQVARAVYLCMGFSEVGVRRNYYPAPAGTREDAIVMSLPFAGAKGFGALD